MLCFICDSPAEFYFSKSYKETPYHQFMADFDPVNYYRCGNCGFTMSRTHQEADQTAWEQLNHAYHNYLEDSPLQERLSNQPPYAEQALMLSILGWHHIIDTSDMIDFAGGRGTLSGILKRYTGLKLPIYEPYVTSGDPDMYVSPADLRTYNTVFNSAMFEHVLSRNHLDNVNALVKPGGALIVHTVVCENIPQDPNWFYLEPPVHSAFHTNKSMSILMEQWGYVASIYSPKSKCWVLLKKEPDHLEMQVNRINQELQCQWFYFKHGFMDYWK